MLEVKMTQKNLEAFLDWAGGEFEQNISLKIENAKRYPSMLEERGPNFLGMAKMCAKYNLQPDYRKVIPVRF